MQPPNTVAPSPRTVTGIFNDGSKVNILVFIHGDTAKAVGRSTKNDSPESLIWALRVG